MPFAESKESHGFNRGRMSICLYQNRNSRSQKQNHPGARRVSYLALKNQASSRRTKRYSGKCSERKRKAACNDNENLASRKRTRNIFSLVKKKLLRSENREEADGGEFNSRFLDLDKSTRGRQPTTATKISLFEKEPETFSRWRKRNYSGARIRKSQMVVNLFSLLGFGQKYKRQGRRSSR